MIVLAAVLWSTSSLFIRLLQEETPLGLDEPELSPLQLAFWRSVFAGIAMLPLIRPRVVRFRPAMGLMVVCFGVMTALYLTALSLGPAANAILLQNTAPVWVYIVGVYLLHDPPDRRTLRAILLAAVGAFVIVLGNWPRGLAPAEEQAQALILLMALGSGLFYAAVILFMNYLKAESAAWLTMLNMFGTSVVVLAFAAAGGVNLGEWLLAPTGEQMLFIALFGTVQMAAPVLPVRPRLEDDLASGSGDHHAVGTAPQPALGIPDRPGPRDADAVDRRRRLRSAHGPGMAVLAAGGDQTGNSFNPPSRIV